MAKSKSASVIVPPDPGIAAAIQHVSKGGRVVIRQRGKAVAAIVSMWDLRVLENCQGIPEAEFAKVLRRRMAEYTRKETSKKRTKKELDCESQPVALKGRSARKK
ncbi:MAG: hypothetical protein NTX50_20775 [Candidatus Sumerlaeota bacterium]|nr:hypothetical protein [Candidatus Sumerlaeota bacterium]